MLHVTDAREITHTFSSAPRRIISLVPSLTELLADLGLKRQVVGLTRFCVRPENWKQEKQIVGGTKQVNHERIERLGPDLIIANREENTKAMVERLDALAPVFVTDIATLDEALATIRTLGRITGRPGRAAEVAEEVGARFAALPSFLPFRAAYMIWRRPYMTAGGDTFINELLTRAGFENAFADRARYPEITLEELDAADLDVLLLSSEPFPFQEKHMPEFEKALPGLPIHLVDGQLFSWYGSRLLHAPAYFRALRAEMRQPANPSR